MKRRSAESVDDFRQSLDFTGIDNHLYTESVHLSQPDLDDQTSSGLDIDLVRNSVLQLAHWGESQFESQPTRNSLFKRHKKSKPTTQFRSLLTDIHNQSAMDFGSGQSTPLLLQRNGSSRPCQQFPSILAMMSDNKPATPQGRRRSLKIRSPLTKKKGSFDIQLASCKSAVTIGNPDTRWPTGHTRKQSSPVERKKRKSFGWTKKKQKSK